MPTGSSMPMPKRESARNERSEVTAEVVCSAFGLGTPVELSGVVARGELGQVRRLVTEHGTWAVKEAFEPPDPTEVRVAGRFQRACSDAGVWCPRPMATAAGEYVLELAGEHVSVASWVDLDDPDPGLDPALVGRVVAGLHQVPAPTSLRPHRWHTDPVGGRRWRSLVKASRSAGAPFADELAGLVPALVDAERLLTPMDPIQLCHADLWADNLRPTPGAGACVIDFDNTTPADPARELAMVLFEFGGLDQARLRDLVGSYREAGGPARVARLEDFGMVVAQLNHIVARHVEGWVAARDAESRARAAAGVAEYLTAPPTRARLDGILGLLP